MGWCYESGNCVAQDYQKAISLYRKSAEQGNDYAQNNLGRCYQLGKGVTQDFTQAEYWYKKAAKQGNSNAKTNLEGLPLAKVKAHGFESIEELKDGFIKYYKVKKNGRYGLTNESRSIIVPTELEALEPAGGGCLRYKLNGFWGLMTFQGSILIDTNRGYTSIGNYTSFTKRFPYTMAGFKGECDAQGYQISKIRVDAPASTPSSSSTKASSTSNGSSSNGQTKKVIVEHHRDPIPVQVWVNCGSCNGSGQCHVCAGGGVSLGPSRSVCIICNGHGRCTHCAGRGGQYIVQYQ